jgi:hypothetical protein
VKKYRVNGYVTISISVVVEAKSKAEARAKALDAPTKQLCHFCCSDEEDGEWTIGGDLDGEVKIQRGGVEVA